MFATLGRFARCVVLDKRGTGLSDRTLGFGSLEERAEDIRAVMDAAEIERATVFGYSESAALALVLSAAHPQRVESLALYSAYARLPSGPDNPDGLAPELTEWFVERISSDWGNGTISPVSFAGVPNTPAARQLLARWERSLCTPTMAAHIIRRNADIDIRPLLPSINTPALVLHSTGDPLCPTSLGRYIADQLPRGRYQQHDRLSPPVARRERLVPRTDRATPHRTPTPPPRTRPIPRNGPRNRAPRASRSRTTPAAPRRRDRPLRRRTDQHSHGRQRLDLRQPLFRNRLRHRDLPRDEPTRLRRQSRDPHRRDRAT
jgi:hypothetical protein